MRASISLAFVILATLVLVGCSTASPGLYEILSSPAQQDLCVRQYSGCTKPLLSKPTVSKPHRIAILGVGRSGTTHLMHLLAATSAHTYVQPEPYFVWQTMYEGGITGYPFPHPAELFDCSAMQSDYYAQVMMWEFACNNSPLIASDEALLAECKAMQLPAATLHSLCKSSPVRIMKLLRLPFVAKQLFTTNLLPRNVRAIHIVRHPARILRSQAMLGWYTDEVTGNPLSPSITYHAEHICSDMLTNADIAGNLNASRVLTIRHEDLLSNYEDTMRDVMCTLGLPYDAALMLSVQDKKSADLPLRWLNLLTFDDALEAVYALPICRRAMQAFGYA